MSNNNNKKDPNKFHNLREDIRFASVEKHGNDKNYNSMMDEFRRAYRARTNKVFKVSSEKLWEIIKRLIYKRYGITEEECFLGSIFQSKFGKNQYEFEISKLSQKSIQLVRTQKNRQQQTFWTTFRVERIITSKDKSRLIITESVKQNTTIQGFDGQLEKSFFKLNTKKNFKVWKEEIKKAIEQQEGK